KYLEDRFTPELWLFAQIFPRRYYADGDLFEKLVDILRHLDSKELKLFLEKYYVSQCTFFLDESQTLIDVNPKYFLSESNPLLGSSLLNAVKTSVFKISGLKFVPSGTGLRIGDVYGNEAVISGAAKQSGYRNVLIVSNIWENLENIEDYISTYLGDNNIDKKNCELLLGRPRPAARFVEYCLEKILVKEELNFNEEFSKFYKDLTSINDVKWSLSQLFDPKRLTYASEVLETLKMAVYFSYCFGFPYIISAAEGKMLFERSFGILVENEDLANALKDKMEKKEYFKNEVLPNLAIIIREPFILRTAFNYFSLKNTDFLKITAEQRLSIVFNESSRGYLWEDYFPFRFKQLAETQNLLNILMESEVCRCSHIANIENTPLIKKSKDFTSKIETKFSDFLRNPEKYGPFFQPIENAGPDLCFFIKDDTETMYPVFVQLKLSRHVTRVAALNTVVPKLFYHINRGAESELANKYREEYNACIEVLTEKYNRRYIGIAIVYPQTWKNEIKNTSADKDGWFGTKKLFDIENAPEIFDQEH
ncbi:hypothetical protein HDU92_000407, partial [Lobulomyces angularis]